MKFFLDAGIPKESSAEYAVNFEENRMEMDMLAELDKDLLRYNIQYSKWEFLHIQKEPSLTSNISAKNVSN